MNPALQKPVRPVQKPSDMKNKMTEIQKSVKGLLEDDSRLDSMLMLEKKRRGVAEDDLVFIGMANAANYWWCAIKAVLQSRKEERGFFLAYLTDRLLYADQFGHLHEIPKMEEEWLQIGDSITFTDIDKILRESEKEWLKFKYMMGLESSDDLYSVSEELPFMMGTGALPPKERGIILEDQFGKKYPQIRWNFRWGKYVVVGIPDGITSELVYEFKSTGKKFLLNFTRPVALAQADLYGLFFKRTLKEVEIFVVEDDKIQSWKEQVDISNARTTLERFSKVDSGETPILPMKWKCKVCEFFEECSLSPAKQ